MTLKDIISRHATADDPNGLLLLTLPTGFGKTYYALQYMKEQIQLTDGPRQNIWFVTTLKKNLPVDDLKALVGEDLFDQYVLQVKSYVDLVTDYIQINGGLPERAKEIPHASEMTKWAIQYKACPKDASPDFKRYLYEKLSEAERQFRNALKAYLKPKLKGQSEARGRLNELRSDKNLRWVEELYPIVAVFEKSVFFSTVRKFYTQLDTIIGPAVQIATSGIVENSVVFIDEFDASKQHIQDAIVEHTERYTQDILGLFVRIARGVDARSLPTSRLRPMIAEQELSYLQDRFDRLRAEAEAIRSGFHFDYHFLLRSATAQDRAFLFHDYRYHTFVGDNRAYLKVEPSKADATNYIHTQPEPPETEQENLLFLLNKLKGFIWMFAYFVGDLSRVYQSVHSKRPETEERMSSGNAIRTCLEVFDINDVPTHRFFEDFITQRTFSAGLSRGDLMDESPLGQGFRYFDLLNSQAHDANTKLRFADTLTTPERWMLGLCQRALVIGISATAGFDAPLSNYSLAFLRAHLQNRFHAVLPDEVAALESAFRERYAQAGRHKISVEAVSCPVDQALALKALLPGAGKEVYKTLAHQLPGDEGAYATSRYIKLGMAYARFIREEDCHSFLCLLNKLPRKGQNDDFTEEGLISILTEIRICYLKETEEEAKQEVSSSLYIVDSSGFEHSFERICEHLKKGHDAFVVSTYQTMGAGQNIQYEPHSEQKVVAVNDLEYGDGKKDYDGIYLEQPTHLLAYFRSGEAISDTDLIHYLFEVAYLEAGGAISQEQKSARVRYIFGRKLNKYAVLNSGSVRESESVVAHYCRVIIQAVGRLSRTRLKPPVTHLLYDQNLARYLSQFSAEGHLLVREFEALQQHAQGQEQGNPTDPAEKIHNQNVSTSIQTATLLRKLARRGIWQQSEMDFWEGLRTYVLKNPTDSKERVTRNGLMRFYIAHPGGEQLRMYNYQTRSDFKNDLSIFFNQESGKSASEDAARLPELMKIRTIQMLFEQKGYAMEFQANERMVSPPTFQNIYLGALGEVIGAHLLEKHGISCRPLPPEHYERFDAVADNGIYLDFKYWGAGTRVDARVQKEKIRKKLEEVGGKAAIIVNIVSPAPDYQPVTGEDGIIEVPGLLDLSRGVVLEEHLQFIHDKIMKL